jgi:hypothetical protein
MSILPQLENDLRRAADRRFVAAPTLRPRRLGGILAVAASLAAVLVAVGALALLGHDRRQNRSQHPGRPLTANSRAQLLATLGVLRRRQTEAGRQAVGTHTRDAAIPAQNGLRVDRSLMRFVPGAAGSAVVLLPVGDAHGHYGLQLSLLFPNGGGALDNPASIGAVRAHGAELCAAWHLRNVCAIVVPDGVTRVVLGAPSVVGQSVTIHPATCCVTAAVHDNVATFAIPALTAASRRLPRYLYYVTARSTMSWFDGRHAVAHLKTSLDLTASVDHGRLRSPKDAIPSAQLCAREIADCRRLTQGPQRGPRRH